MPLPYEYGMNQKGCNMMKRNLSWKRYCIFILMLLFCVNLAGCAGNGAEETATVETTEETGPQQRLVLTLTRNENGGFVQATPQLEGKIGSGELLYNGLAAVAIELDGESVDLIEAIQNDEITLEEILAYAKIDARNGLCEMKYQSKLGYAHYGYCYEGFEILSAYDVFEDIDGELYHVESMTIGTPGVYDGTVFGKPIIEKDGTEVFLGVEDWGLTFEIKETKPDGIVLDCIQTESQQNGDVEFLYYLIYQKNEEGHRKMLQTQDSSEAMDPVKLQKNGTTELDLSWQEEYGELSSGTYYLELNFEDVYTDNNPMVKDYSQLKYYTIQFEIP